jgi:hypothetical protein
MIYLLFAFGMYSLYIINTENNYSYFVGLVLFALFFILLGLLFGNHIHKKGLIFGILLSIIHLFLIKIIILLATGDFTFNIFSFLIYSICGGIGGFLGINFKKLI